MTVKVIQPGSHEAVIDAGWELHGVYPTISESQELFERLEQEFVQAAISFFDGNGEPVPPERVAFWINNRL